MAAPACGRSMATMGAPPAPRTSSAARKGAGTGGGLTKRSPRIRPKRERRHPGGDGAGRAATRPAGNAVEGPRILRRAKRGVLGGRSHRKLVAVGFAENDGAGGLETRHDR